MSDIKWIKITTDIFDDEKILLIESLPEADAIIVIWFKLLCLAGKQNNSGVFLMNDRIAYTDKMLATIFRRKESVVQLALKTFEEFGMVELVDGVITIPNWGKHQSLDQLENKKEYMRNYMKEYRQKQRQIADGKTNNKANVSSAEKDKDKEEEIEREIEEDTDTRDRTDYKKIVGLYNTICLSFPQVKTLSDSRKRAIKARTKQYSIDDFETVFRKAEASSFLKGGSNSQWTASFDWMIKDANFVKILEGNYDDKASKTSAQKWNADNEDLYNRGLREWVNS